MLLAMSVTAVERRKAVDRWSESLVRVSDVLNEYEDASRHLQDQCDLSQNAIQESHNGGGAGDGLSIEQT
jgi:hypothetical protein